MTLSDTYVIKFISVTYKTILKDKKNKELVKECVNTLHHFKSCTVRKF